MEANGLINLSSGQLGAPVTEILNWVELIENNCTFQPAYKELGKERPWIECHVRIERKARESKTGKGNGIISNWVIEVVGSMMFVPTYEAPDDETLSKALEKEFF